MTEFITSANGQEFRDLVRHYTADVEPIYTPGPTRFSEAETRGFRHINPSGMFMIAIIESRIYLKNRAARAVAKRVVGSEVLLSNIILSNLEDPAQSRSYLAGATSTDRLVVVQDGERPRTADEDDIAALNQALSHTSSNPEA